MQPQEILQSEGFVHIYKWHDEPNTQYPSHAHKGKVTLFIETGEVRFTFADTTTHTIKADERFDVPVGLEHTATVGSSGCDYIVGEMIKGDS